jgi:hypothetical protein
MSADMYLRIENFSANEYENFDIREGEESWPFLRRCRLLAGSALESQTLLTINVSRSYGTNAYCSLGDHQ